MANTQIPAKGLSQPNQFRNLIINGDMSIAQRSTSATGIGGSDTYPAIDRIRFYSQGSPTGRFTVSQETLSTSDTPYTHGFTKYMKLDCTTADTALTASQRHMLMQGIEGQNLTYIRKGSSSAKKLTFSCWIKSNKTGTVTVELFDAINTRQISKTFTIDTADTWEKKIITYEGDTTGTMTNVNTSGIDFAMWIGAGTDYTSGTLSTTWSSNTNSNRCSSSNINFADSTDNELLTTGWQLEAAEVASEFEFLPNAINENLCLRYFYKDDCDLFMYTNRVSDAPRAGHKQFPVPMRSAPSFTSISATEISNTAMTDSSRFMATFRQSGSDGSLPRYNSYSFSAEL